MGLSKRTFCEAEPRGMYPVFNIQKEFDKGVGQIAKYMKDKRFANRPYLKKFVVVFAGIEVAKLVELE